MLQALEREQTVRDRVLTIEPDTESRKAEAAVSGYPR